MRKRSAPPWGALVALCSGCGFATPVEPHAVRVVASARALVPESGLFFAREDLPEAAAKGITDISGDALRLDRDIELEPGLGLGVDLEVSPTDDDGLGLTVRLVPGLSGRRVGHRRRRFDGAAFGPDERLSARLMGGWARASYARRVLAPRGDVGLDLLARAGLERCDLDARVSGARTAAEHRAIRVAAPWVGLEARLLVLEAPHVVARLELDAGYWHHDGVRLALADAALGLTIGLVGPVFADLRYELAARDAESDLGLGEVSRAALLTHGASLGLGVAF